MGTNGRHDELARFFRLLSHPVAMEVVRCLGQRYYTLSELAQTLETSKPCVCKRTTKLHDAGVLDKVRIGRRLHYCLREWKVLNLIRHVRRFVRTRAG